jgi:hypothetical protein
MRHGRDGDDQRAGEQALWQTPPKPTREQAIERPRLARTTASVTASVHHKPVADAAHGLQVQRMGRIGFDLRRRRVDLHVDGAFVRDVAGASQRLPRGAVRREPAKE